MTGATAPGPRPAAPATDGAIDPLPTPRRVGPLSLEETLLARRSVRELGGGPLTRAEVGQLLWAAQGVTDAEGHRAAPSAGARYPLRLDVVTADSVARYLPERHALVRRFAGDVRPALRHATGDQATVAEAPLAIVVSAVAEATASRYGPERAQRYLTLEAGHAVQDVLLQAVGLGLAALPAGAFDDDEVRRVVALADDEAPLYLVLVGRPR